MDDVVVGVVGRPLGVRGELHVRPDGDVGFAFVPGARCRGRDGAVLEVAASRDHGGRTVVRFAGVGDREAAEELRGTVLRVARAEVQLDDDRVWSDTVVGREVHDDAGSLVGVVEAVADGPAHDYLVVARPDGGEVMVPAVAELVDLADDRVVVRAIPGLLDPEQT